MKMKVKTELTKKDLAELKAANIKKARAWFAMHPYATKVYMCLKTTFPQSFIFGNWEEITKDL